jgi:diadenosine tetraphosphate (Ap4A) HIT family hydrolase
MKSYERYHPDMKALHSSFQTDPCFVCEIIKGRSNSAAYIVYEDDAFIAFLDAYPRQCGYTLVSPKRHLEQVSADFDLREYLSLQELVYHISEAVRVEVDAERMYIFSFGSNQGNAHVHWHVAPLPKGTSYDPQQGAAVGWQAGVLKIPHEEMKALAARILRRIAERVNG